MAPLNEAPRGTPIATETRALEAPQEAPPTTKKADKYTAKDALHCVVNFGLSVPEALRITKNICTRQHLYRLVKKTREEHGEESFARRTIGMPDLITFGKQAENIISPLTGSDNGMQDGQRTVSWNISIHASFKESNTSITSIVGTDESNINEFSTNQSSSITNNSQTITNASTTTNEAATTSPQAKRHRKSPIKNTMNVYN